MFCSRADRRLGGAWWIGVERTPKLRASASTQSSSEADGACRMSWKWACYIAAIYSLHDKGWSRRRIARELGLNRETVGRYLRLAKPAISTAGFEEPCQAKPAIPTTGTMAGRKSQCEPLAEAILAKVEVGLSARRIYQDLVEENGFADSYESVKRFRKGYSEALYRQDTDTFLRCLENGLRSFGGTPLLLNLDNFKAAVRNADWFDPDMPARKART